MHLFFHYSKHIFQVFSQGKKGVCVCILPLRVGVICGVCVNSYTLRLFQGSKFTISVCVVFFFVFLMIQVEEFAVKNTLTFKLH